MTISDTFLELNALQHREPRQFVKIADGGETWYITSHADIVTPDPSKTIHSVLIDIPIESQSIDFLNANSEIGTGTVKMRDISDALTDYLNARWVAGYSMRKKTFTFYYGYRGMESADYYQTGVHICDGSISVTNDTYELKTADLQRTLKDTIFAQVFTTLKSSTDDTQTYLIVNDPTDFETIRHDANFSHLPNTVVGYVKIESERISWLNKLDTAISGSASDISFSSADNSINVPSASPLSLDLSQFSVGQGLNVSGSSINDGTYTIATVTATKITVSETLITEAVASPNVTITLLADTQFYNCTRGVLNSKAVVHTVDDTAAIDRRLEVAEWIYLETNIFKLIYGIYTGVWYGTAYTWPTNWHLGISTSLIEATDFTSQTDLWNTSDDSGFILRFEGRKETNAKKFLETQLFMLAGGYQRIVNNGNIGFKRAARVISGTAPDAYLTNADLARDFDPTLEYALRDVINLFSFRWNHDPDKERNTRLTPVVDDASIAKYGAADRTYDFAFEGLHGSIHTTPTLYNIADGIRDRYSGHPLRLTIKTLPKHAVYEPGQILYCDFDNIKDYTNSDTKRIKGPFEVQKKTWANGYATYDLFGSAEEATPLSIVTGNVLQDNFYNSEGSNAGAASPSLLPGTSSGGTFTMTGNATLTGNADVTNATAIYYIYENFTIADGVTLTLTQNVQLRILGLFTCNGKVDLKGQGLTGGTGTTSGIITRGRNGYKGSPGTAGFVGTTQAGGGVYLTAGAFSFEEPALKGTHTTAPYLNITNTLSGSPQTNVLTGIPTDLRGTSGGSGGPVNIDPYSNGTFTLAQAGGPGGAGGGGLLIICRGMVFGANGEIDSSGDAGSLGSIASSPYSSGFQAYPGSGAPGCPGAVYVLIDNKASNLPDNNVIADIVQPQVQGTPWAILQNFNASVPSPGYSNYIGTLSQDAKLSVFRVQYVPKAETAENDVATIANAPQSITATDGGATVNVPNRIMVAMYATAPTDAGNYAYSNLYIRESGQTAWAPIGGSTGAGDTVEYPMKLSTTYDIKAQAVSIDGIESQEYITTTHTAAAETVTISQDVKQNNTNALYTDCIFINAILSNVKSAQITTGSYTITDAAGSRQFQNTTSETAVYAFDSIDRPLDLTTATWDKDRVLIVRVNKATTSDDGSVCFGYYIKGVSETVRHFGFYIDSSLTCYATNSDGTTQHTQSLGTVGVTNTLMAILNTSGTPTIYYYVNGTLQHTTTTNVPTGTTDATKVFSSSLYKTGTGTSLMQVGEVKAHQAP